MRLRLVTPFVGVWIETHRYCVCMPIESVTPFVGVWIETLKDKAMQLEAVVTPFVGVWIETKLLKISIQSSSSHTLRGCVD